jgi:triacylglycerol lipase
VVGYERFVTPDCSMSKAVELDRDQYPDNALSGFKAIPQFALANARAMMWMSQLAYETAHVSKIDEILGAWKLKKLKFESNEPHTGLPPHSACMIVAENAEATFVTFAGSDPFKIQDWVTDFEATPTPEGLHAGFDAAVDGVWDQKLKPAIASPATPGKPVFFCGHSLGGALAILAAARAAHEPNPRQIVVYTFGSPRNGGEAFFNDYTPRLGSSTFRLVHGTDIVPTVPLTLLGVYRHVGQAVQCRTDGVFDGVAPMAPDGNKPDLIESIIQSEMANLGALITLQLFHGIGPGLRNALAGFLPRIVRDHVPASYFRALSITIR